MSRSAESSLGSSASSTESIYDTPQRRGQLLLVSLLETICGTHTIFKFVSSQLIRMGMVDAETMRDDVRHLRDTYRLFIRAIIQRATKLSDPSPRSLVPGARPAFAASPAPPAADPSALVQYAMQQGLATLDLAKARASVALPSSSSMALVPVSADHPSQRESSTNSMDLPLTPLPSQSRYAQDFEEHEKLGEGGFGAVMRATHRLDGLEYAIKRVPLTSNNLHVYRQVLREVKLLARLDHAHIVRYHGAWVEQQHDSTTSFHIETLDDDMIDDDASQASDDSDDDVVFDHHECSTPTTPTVHMPALRLFIHMELCHSSLKEWLVSPDAAHSTPDLRRDLIRQTLRGLSHVHQCGIVHRDIKPGNLFLVFSPSSSSSRPHVKLGDFGLAININPTSRPKSPQENSATPDHSSSSSSSSTSTTRSTSAVGTSLYASPEQLQGTHWPRAQDDVFSVAIVALETLCPSIHSRMELFALVDRIRSPPHTLPPDFIAQYPRESRFVLDLARSPSETRPSALAALHSSFFVDPPPKATLTCTTLSLNPSPSSSHYDPSLTSDDLRRLLCERDSEIVRLSQLLNAQRK